MFSILLAIIYLAFISLGLPDALLGSAWSVMRVDVAVPISYAGIIYVVIAVGTVISSLLSDRLTKKFGVGLVVAASVLLSAAGLIGFSISGSFYLLCISAIPYGLGAGAVDAALNNFVALHYRSRHMNWLHCFWGVGASISPYIMGYCLTNGFGWGSGYRTVAVIQVVLAAVMFAALPLWKKQSADMQENALDTQSRPGALKLSQIFRIKGVLLILPAFFAYCAIEHTVGLWASSFLVLERNVPPETAANYAAYFFLGITAGRFLCGFISDKVGDRNMLRIGIGVMIMGIAAVWLPVSANWLCLNGLIVVGLGCAPVYPSIIHATPTNFGKENSQAIIGVQMASAYMGITVMPPLFGIIADKISIDLFPLFMLVLAVAMLMLTERLNRILGRFEVK